MIVAGGTYREICEFPYDEQLFGSGLRAAAAVREVSDKTTELHTFLDENTLAEARRKSGAYGFDLQGSEIPETITYHYIHNHSNPAKKSNLSSLDRKLGPISGNEVLRFGIVEGDIIVNGNRVVYDPQSATASQFHQNESEANELALVLNRNEARQFSGEDSIDGMLTALTSGDQSADVVVIKCGASGAVVRVNDKTTQIPVYEPDSIWNIGSGDIFSAMFAAYWAEHQRPAVEAAEEASLATAYYCGTRDLPIPQSPSEINRFEPTRRDPTIRNGNPTIYLAAPFFNPGEFWMMEEVEQILTGEGANTIAPYFDIGKANKFEEPTSVAEKDLNELEKADVLLALVDTYDPGTLFEVGYARNLDIPVVAYQTETNPARTTMLEGSGCVVCNDLSTAVFKSMWARQW